MDEPSNRAEAYLTLAAVYRQELDELKQNHIPHEDSLLVQKRIFLINWLDSHVPKTDSAEIERLLPLMNECYNLNQEIERLQSELVENLQQKMRQFQREIRQAKKFATTQTTTPRFVDRQG